VDYEDDYDEDGIGSPQGLVSLLDRGSSQSATMLRTSQSDLSGSRQMERKGLLWLLDEETVCPGGSDETFLDRLFSHYGDRGTIRSCNMVAAFVSNDESYVSVVDFTEKR